MQYTHLHLSLSISLLAFLKISSVAAFKCRSPTPDNKVTAEAFCCYELTAHFGAGWKMEENSCLSAPVKQNGEEGFECLGFDRNNDGSKEGSQKEKKKRDYNKRVKTSKNLKDRRGGGKGRDGDGEKAVLKVVEACCFFKENGFEMVCDDPEPEDDDKNDGKKEGKKEGGKDDKDEGEDEGKQEVVIRIEM